MSNTAFILDAFHAEGPRWTGLLARGEGKLPDGRAGAGLAGIAETSDLPQDWSGYQSLQFTVYNPWSVPGIGGLQIWDREGECSPNRDYGDIVDLKRNL